MKGRRKLRVEERIKREVSRAIVEDVKNPKVGFVTVVHVEISPDLKDAHVRVSVLEEDLAEKSVAALNSMRGFLQKNLGTVLMTRNTPILHFSLDTGTSQAFRVDQLLRLDDKDNSQPEDKFEDS